MAEDFVPMRFIGETVSVEHQTAPVLRKKPTCPDSFRWGEEDFTVMEMLSSWFDFARRGRMARNMRAEHLERASRRGSWGVGRFYFRVKTGCGRYFDLYYDRAPVDADDRSGRWVLFRELSPGAPG